MGCGEGDEHRVLEEFPTCHLVYATHLKPVVLHIATGMVQFINRDLWQGIVDVDQYNQSGHFVEGWWVKVSVVSSW